MACKTEIKGTAMISLSDQTKTTKTFASQLRQQQQPSFVK
jgi:hypothetical protein